MSWLTTVGATPEICGAVFVAPAETVIENAGSDVVTWPSETRMTMLLNVPAIAVPSVHILQVEIST